MLVIKDKSGRATYLNTAVGFTGCSSRLQAIKSRQPAAGAGRTKYWYNVLADTLTMLGTGLHGVIFPAFPELATRQAARPTKHGGRIWFEMSIGGNPAGLFTAHEDSVILSNPEKQLPTWLLRPHEMFGVEEAFNTGCLSLTGNVKSSGGMYGQAAISAPKTFPKPYGNNTPLPIPKKVNLKKSMYTTGYTEGADRSNIRQMSCSTSAQPPVFGYLNKAEFVREGELSKEEYMNPSGLEIKNLCRHWWWRWPICGYEIPTPEELVSYQLATAADEAQKWTHEDRPFMMTVGGNLRPDTPVDSNRMVLSMAEATGWKSPLDGHSKFKTQSGKTVYFSLVPYIWESHLHTDHPVIGGFFSNRPITWRQL